MNIKAIFKIALALMFGGVIITGMFTLNQEGFQPRLGLIGDQITEYGTPTVTIGAPPNDSPEMARKQMEGLIVWNSLAASNCRLVAAAHRMTGSPWGDHVEEVEELDTDDKETPIVYYEDASNWVYGEDKPAILEENRNGIFSFKHGFEPLIRGGFSKECLGSQSVVKEIKDEMKKQAEETSGGIIGGLTSIGDKTLSFGLCPVCSAANYANGGEISWTGDHYEDVGKWAGKAIVPGAKENFAAATGFDMEAQFGRVNFEVNRTFHMGKDYPDPIAGFNFKAGESGEPDWKDKTPGFWQGKRFMYAVPPGINPQKTSGGAPIVGTEDVDGSRCCVLEPSDVEAGFDDHKIKLDASQVWSGPFDGENNHGGFTDDRSEFRAFYAWRVRMINQELLNEEGAEGKSGDDGKSYNIPLAADKVIENSTLEYSGSGIQANIIRELLGRTEWVMCKGAEGYVQSNAGKMFKEGEVQLKNPRKEDNVYPMVKITEGALDCLEPDGNLRSISEINGVNSKEGLKDAFYDHWDEDFQEFLKCENRNQLGKEDIVFSRGFATGGKLQTTFLCGGEANYVEIDRSENAYRAKGLKPHSDYVRYYTPEFKIEGCTSSNFDITSQSEDELDQNILWKHYPTYDYKEDEEGRKDQIVHENLKFSTDNPRENKILEVNVSHSEGDLRAIIEEKYEDGEFKYKSVVFRENGYQLSKKSSEKSRSKRFVLDFVNGSLTLVDSNTRVDSSIEGTDLLEYLGADITEYEPGNEIESISIGKVTSKRVDDINQQVDNDDIEFSSSSGEFDLEQVVAYGEPKVCHKAFSEN